MVNRIIWYWIQFVKGERLNVRLSLFSIYCKFIRDKLSIPCRSSFTREYQFQIRQPRFENSTFLNFCLHRERNEITCQERMDISDSSTNKNKWNFGPNRFFGSFDTEVKWYFSGVRADAFRNNGQRIFFTTRSKTFSTRIETKLATGCFCSNTADKRNIYFTGR